MTADLLPRWIRLLLALGGPAGAALGRLTAAPYATAVLTTAGRPTPTR